MSSLSQGFLVMDVKASSSDQKEKESFELSFVWKSVFHFRSCISTGYRIQYIKDLLSALKGKSCSGFFFLSFFFSLNFDKQPTTPTSWGPLLHRDISLADSQRFPPLAFSICLGWVGSWLVWISLDRGLPSTEIENMRKSNTRLTQLSYNNEQKYWQSRREKPIVEWRCHKNSNTDLDPHKGSEMTKREKLSMKKRTDDRNAWVSGLCWTVSCHLGTRQSHLEWENLN